MIENIFRSWPGLLFSLLLALCIFEQAAAAIETTNGVGTLIAVSVRDNTVVVEIREGTQQHTVGGQIAVDALLLRSGKRTSLKNFQVGETVRVVWKDTHQGQEIVSLWSNGPVPTGNKARTRNLHDKGPPGPPDQGTIIGKSQRHVVGDKETFLDIARHYSLGYNELTELYPDIDPWLPPQGMELTIPSLRILPDAARQGIVINIPELRLYYFTRTGKNLTVTTLPVGIGDTAFPSPVGTYVIGSKRVNPTWYIPPSLRAKYKVTNIPPGPNNPLGDYWMGLKGTMYGLHGTDFPWSVGRLVTHGCIRLYPEDIKNLFKIVKAGTMVQLVYQPVKISVVSDRLFIEVHRDVYRAVGNLGRYAQIRIAAKGLWQWVDQKKFRQAVEQQNGLPVDITRDAPDRYSSSPNRLMVQ